MPHTVELYHFPPSLCSQKVRLALAEKGVGCTPHRVNIGPPMQNYEPWYARINPKMVVPTLVIDGEVITDSARIIVAIDERLEGPPLGAADPEVGRWIALQDGLKIRELAYSRQDGLMGFLVRGSFKKRVAVLTRMRDSNPELAHLYAARLDDVSAWRQTSSSPDEIEQLRGALLAALEAVEGALSESEYLAGDRYTLADVVWTVLLARMKFMGLRPRWGEATRRYYDRMKVRDSFKTADIWEHIKPLVMLPIIGEVIAMRLGLSR